MLQSIGWSVPAVLRDAINAVTELMVSVARHRLVRTCSVVVGVAVPTGRR
jgi:hypothetical protein